MHEQNKFYILFFVKMQYMHENFFFVKSKFSMYELISKLIFLTV